MSPPIGLGLGLGSLGSLGGTWPPAPPIGYAYKIDLNGNFELTVDGFFELVRAA